MRTAGPATANSTWPVAQPTPADPRRQDGLGEPAGLLRTQPEHGLHRVRRGEQRHEAHRGVQEGVDHPLPAAELLEHVAAALTADHVLDVLRHTADGRAVHRETGGPAEQGAALQPPGEPERPAQAGARLGRAGPFGQQPGADVTPAGERVRRGDADGGERHREDQHPPVVPRVRPEVGEPAERREPQQPGRAVVTARVAGRADQVAKAEERDAQAAGRTGGRGELGRDGRDGGERQADGEPAEREDDRPGGGQAQGDEADAHEHREHQVGRHHRDQSRGERGVPSDDAGAEEFEAARLLVAARVPHGEEEGDRADERGGDPAGLPQAHRADRRRVVHRAVQRQQRGIAVHRRGEVDSLGERVVRRPAAVGHADRHGREEVDPEGHGDAVAAEGQPGEQARARERVHLAPAVSPS
jgi:hypothetical protein